MTQKKKQKRPEKKRKEQTINQLYLTSDINSIV